MDANTLLSGLNVLIACIGTLFVVLTLFEFRALRALRKDFGRIKLDLKEDLYKTQRAMQRVIASYAIQDVDARIAILKEAVQIAPDVFNGYNALGYAYREKGMRQRALDCFIEAVRQHPKDKAGYFDLAHAYLDMGETDLCVKYLEKAVDVDPSSRADIATDSLLASVISNPRIANLVH